VRSARPLGDKGNVWSQEGMERSRSKAEVGLVEAQPFGSVLFRRKRELRRVQRFGGKGQGKRSLQPRRRKQLYSKVHAKRRKTGPHKREGEEGAPGGKSLPTLEKRERNWGGAFQGGDEGANVEHKKSI